MNSNPSEFGDHLKKLIDGWEENAPEATIASLTLAQFKAKVKASLDARAQIADLRLKFIIARTDRGNADLASVEIASNVVNSVKGDANFGENSALYASFGYIRKADRKSGLKRVSQAAKQSALEVAA